MSLGEPLSGRELAAASRTIGETLLPDWLASFRVTAPVARVSVAITNSEQVARAVREGTAEIGFVEGPAGSMQGLAELVVARDELRVVVAREHRWTSRRSLPVRALTEEPHGLLIVGWLTAAARTAAGVLDGRLFLPAGDPAAAALTEKIPRAAQAALA